MRCELHLNAQQSIWWENLVGSSPEETCLDGKRMVELKWNRGDGSCNAEELEQRIFCAE